MPDKIEIIRDGSEYIIKNKKLERMVLMTDLENEEALNYLKYKLKKLKIGDRLKKMGLAEGSTVIIGNLVFELTD
ncbi:MAG: Obg family GTPase CgtA [Actinobacteria bacterium]|nr:Obg family GTPase CgtA [Actinomycetota bacterium]